MSKHMKINKNKIDNFPFSKLQVLKTLMSLATFFAVVFLTAGTFFAVGAYYQHLDVLRHIQNLERRDVHAYYIRRKLYALLKIFQTPKNNIDSVDDGSDSDSVANHHIGRIMKYGFPSMNEIALNQNYVTSYDRRNSAIHWMCEHLEGSNAPYFFSPVIRANDDAVPSGYRQHVGNRDNIFNRNAGYTGILPTQSDANRVFYMTNIKPFLSKGFNHNVWAKLQIYVHEMTIRYGSVYVYTGSIYMPTESAKDQWTLEYKSENTTMVAIPTHFFKIVIIDPQMVNFTPYSEAFVLPNATLKDNIDLRTLLCDIRDIENATGLQFFEGLDRNFVNTQALPKHRNSLGIVRHS